MQLDSKAVLYFLLQRMVLWLFLSVWFGLMFGAGGSSSQHPVPGIRWEAIGAWTGLSLALLLIVNGAFCRVKARSYLIGLRKEGVALDYGVLNKYHETVLYGKIQDIMIRRGVLERMLGLATVVIQNAAGSPLIIPGLGEDTALKLRDDILERVPRG